MSCLPPWNYSTLSELKPWTTIFSAGFLKKWEQKISSNAQVCWFPKVYVLKYYNCNLDSCLLTYSFIYLLMRKRKAIFQTVGQGVYSERVLLERDFLIFQWGKICKFEVLPLALWMQMEITISFGQTTVGSIQCFRMCFCKLNFRETISCKFRQLGTWQNTF